MRPTLASSDGVTLLYGEIPDAARLDANLAKNPPAFRVVDWTREPVLDSEHDARKRIYLVTPKLFGTKAVKGEMIIYPPGTQAANHHHVGAEHFMYVLRGRGTVYANERPFPVRKGDVIYYPDLERHYLEAAPDEELVFAEFFAPGEFTTVWVDESQICTWKPTGRDIKGRAPVREIKAHSSARCSVRGMFKVARLRFGASARQPSPASLDSCLAEPKPRSERRLVPAEGFEPPTTRLRSGCSTAELRRLKLEKRATDIGAGPEWQYSARPLTKQLHETLPGRARRRRRWVPAPDRSPGRNPGPDRRARAPAGSPARPASLWRPICADLRLAAVPAWPAASGRRDRDRRGGRPQWRRRDLDHRPRDADLGQRHLPGEAVEPPVRRDRQPALGHHAVGGPHRIAGRAHGAAHPFAHAAFVAVLGLLDLRHQRGDAPRRRRQIRRQRRARDGEFARIERGARHGKRAFELARHHVGASFCMRASRSRALSPSRKFA